MTTNKYPNTLLLVNTDPSVRLSVRNGKQQSDQHLFKTPQTKTSNAIEISISENVCYLYYVKKKIHYSQLYYDLLYYAVRLIHL